MTRNKIPKKCACGCGEMTKGGDWKVGHNRIGNGYTTTFNQRAINETYAFSRKKQS